MSWWQVPRTRAPSGEKWQLRGGTVRFAMWIFCWILANHTGFSPKTSFKNTQKDVQQEDHWRIIWVCPKREGHWGYMRIPYIQFIAIFILKCLRFCDKKGPWHWNMCSSFLPGMKHHQTGHLQWQWSLHSNDLPIRLKIIIWMVGLIVPSPCDIFICSIHDFVLSGQHWPNFRRLYL